MDIEKSASGIQVVKTTANVFSGFAYMLLLTCFTLVVFGFIYLGKEFFVRSGIVREDFTESRLPTVPHDVEDYIKLEGNPLNENDLSAQYMRSMDIWKQWVKKGARPKNNSEGLIAVSLTSNGFEKNYKDIAATVNLAEDYILEEGVCFLIRNEVGGNKSIYKPVYRQMPFKIDEKLTTNTITFLEPNAGDQMLMMLKVRGKNNKDCPTNLSQYQINVVPTR